MGFYEIQCIKQVFSLTYIAAGIRGLEKRSHPKRMVSFFSIYLFFYLVSFKKEQNIID